jgi:uncharacterized alpha-E superfamily protein
MPRSIAACYENITRYLDLLARDYGRQGPCQRLSRATASKLESANIDEVFQSGLHEFLAEVIDANNRLGATISEQYLV